MPIDNTYTLRTKKDLFQGDYVEVNGPYDKYGIVLKLVKIDENGHWYMIRGRGFKKPLAPIKAKF